MSRDHRLFHYSITCKTESLAVLHCLRALCQYAEEHSKPQIGWGGTGENQWRANGKKVTFRFSQPEFRSQFQETAEELLGDYWLKIETDDDDPAVPRRHA